ncbi:Non-specific serine/threonine protein kinase [Vibrio jasicida]|uniref:serine/threonine-protein kinase n=1 Tax=Vibrio jasicida TaxID=766224 RepID=UPI002894B600|nr:Non-specific serine/threonine protein kinase [Vibrio jasicida]
MEDQSKNSSINKDTSGDKTKIVKTQKRENTVDKIVDSNYEGSAQLNNETNTKMSQNQNTYSLDNKIDNTSCNQREPSTSQSLVGETIKSRYEIESLIGHGGLCDVYLAKDKILESSGTDKPYVALKILQEEFSSQPETARMLIREAQQTQKLSHPNIIRVYDFGVDGDVYFLVMEYVDGETLETLIQRSRPDGLKFKAALSILNETLNALAYAHSLGVVHADLKPANIILTSEGKVKLLDFGVSKTQQLKHDQYAAKRKTQESDTLGFTPNYASLDVLSGNAPQFSDDIFALCCITYELLSCKHPYARTPVDEALKKNVRVTKPAHFPLTKWSLVSKVLNKGLAPTDLSAELLKQHINKTRWPVYTSVVASLVVATLLGLVYQGQQDQLTQLEAALNQQTKHISSAQALLDTAPENTKSLIDSQHDLHPVIKAGFLRLYKPYLLGAYESKIDDVLNSDVSTYPNYDQIEEILQQAKVYYPDSHKIEVLALDIQSSKHSTLLSIARQINSQLEKSSYTQIEGSKSIYDLKQELHQIHQEYPFVPSSLASEVFGQHLNEALQLRDAAALVTLIKVGNTFFADSDEHRQNIAISNAMKDAVLEMKLFETAKDSQNPLPFPADAARLLYQEEFEGLYYRLKQARTTVNLDKLVKDIDLFSENFPTGFQDINDLRFQTADKYLQFSDILLNKRKSTSARRAMKKANELLRRIETDSVQS